MPNKTLILDIKKVFEEVASANFVPNSEVETLRTEIEHLTAENKRLQSLLNDLMIID